MVLGRDHRMRPRRIGHAQRSAKVMGIGHAVEHQQQRSAFNAVEQFVEIAPGSGPIAIGERLVAAGVVRDALTFRVAAKTPEPIIVEAACRGVPVARTVTVTSPLATFSVRYLMSLPFPLKK